MKARSRSTRTKAARTLGLMINWLDDEYQQEIIRSVVDAARQRGLNCLCFDGGDLTKAADMRLRNTVFDLIGPELVDGLIIFTAPLVSFSGMDRLLEYLKRFASLPMVSLSQELPGIPSFTIDNHTGLSEAINHLATVHACRRIAYIGGPPTNRDAHERFAVFRQGLERQGLDFDPALVRHGQFLKTSGYELTRELLAEHPGGFDALVAANDSTAIGAMDALREHGLRVPEDIIVTGFDDIEDARVNDPSLTTIAQPFLEMGPRAVDCLLRLIDGQPVDRLQTLPGALVLRESCGCGGNELSLEFDPGDAYGGSTPERLPGLILQRLAATYPNLRERVSPALATEFIQAIVRAHDTADQLAILGRWRDSVRRTLGGALPGWYLHALLNESYAGLSAALGATHKTGIRFESLFHKARIILARELDRHDQVQAGIFQRQENYLAHFREAVLSFDEAAVVEAMLKYLPMLGVPRFFITRFGDGGGQEASRMVHPAPGASGSQERPTGALIAECLDSEPGAWIIESLSHYHPFGLLVMRMDTPAYRIYSEVRRIASSSLQGAVLFRQLSEEARREKRLTEIYSRYVPREFLNLLEKDSIVDVGLGDQVQKIMTVMFIDIRSFTRLSASLSPAETISFLNRYLQEVGPVIRDNRGFVDKFIGDGIMALFPRTAKDALEAAIAIRGRVDALNRERLAQGQSPIRIGIGFHRGELMLGTVGEHDRMETTAISEAVNVASRLENLNKIYGTSILFSDAVYLNLEHPERYRYRSLDWITLSGWDEPLLIFELLDGLPPEELALKLQTRDGFETGLRHLRNQEFNQALACFEAVLASNPADTVTEIMIARCESGLAKAVLYEDAEALDWASLDIDEKI